MSLFCNMAASMGGFDPADSVVCTKSIPNKGKGLISRKLFNKGDVIVEEKPIICAQFSWNELYKYQACEFCLRSIEAAEPMARRLAGNAGLSLPHPECCDVKQDQIVSCPNCQTMYCSPSCRDGALQQYHQVLCYGPPEGNPEHPLAKLVEVWRSLHYPPETTSIMLIVKMIAMVKQAPDKAAVVSKFSSFVNNTVNEQESIAHKLLGEEFKDQRELLRQMLSCALYEESVQEWFTPDGFNAILALIGTNGQGIGSSSFSRWVKKTEDLQMSEDQKSELNTLIEKIYDDIWEVSGQFLDCEGSGLYTLQSACNHSCAPNAETTFPYGDNTLVLVATEDIKPEEEINISYLSCCDLERSRHSRQKSLRENYLFQCTCDKCLAQADDASVTSEEEEDEDSMEEDI